MQQRRLLKTAAVALLTLVCAGTAWHLDRHRPMPIEDAVNPVWWYRRARGLDLYDPQYAILYHGNRNLREVAITIDDGPHPQYGEAILAALRAEHAPATFFVVGVQVKKDPQFIRDAIADGDEIGNHTYDHHRLPALPPHEIANELRFDDIDIYQAGGGHPTIMRPPGDQYNDKVSHVVKALGYVDVAWTDAAKDYLPQTPQVIAQRVLDRTEPGSIILLHQDYPGTAVAIPVIVDGLRAKGYKFVTVSTMLAHLKVQPYAAQLAADERQQPTSAAAG